MAEKLGAAELYRPAPQSNLFKLEQRQSGMKHSPPPEDILKLEYIQC